MEATVKTPTENEETMSAIELQPFLHDARLSVAAPSFCAARPDGRITEGADGFYHGDRRILSRLEVGAPGVPNAPVATVDAPDGHTAFVTVLRGLAERTADPATTLERRRDLHPGRLVERYTLHNAGALPARLRLEIRAESDFATMDTVKAGRTATPLTPTGEDDGLRWTDGPLTAALTLTPAPHHRDAATGTLGYDLELAPGQSWQAVLQCTAEHRDGDLFPAAATTPWSTPEVTGRDHHLAHWLTRSHHDLRGLLLTDPLRPADTFLGAGAPWFLTLFGRDSLWAARMMLPLGTELAAGTLRTLARRQGRRVDPATEEQPGKILHEVRRAEQHLDTGSHLPPSYYGTADATPLWLVLLHDAWRWGLPAEQVEELLPNAEAALGWLERYADPDGDGFLEYVDSTGRGLSNQGWKDSSDGIRFRDGRIAAAPIALSEVQAYAHEAAVKSADLLEAFGRPGAERWRQWAERLRERFRDRFWAQDEDGRYPVVALDRDKRPVDSIASNLGHLLGTGLLDAEESALVARRLTAPGLDGGFGLRTLDAATAGFNPLGYHTGSVWPHDSAIAVYGLARAGLHQAAAPLAAGLVRAAAAFDHRLPELYAGYPRAQYARPVPYPASCRPQAWAAAAAVLVLQALLGLAADAPNRRLWVRERVPAGYESLRIGGLTVAGLPVEAETDHTGAVRLRAPEGFTVTTVR
ncbi:glycogen debranching N-terminal domain-containing protein [Streptomyces sp. CBMA123]|uniref:amylo-alpha-1,6-glucosidase n=1 Tax=Streptomyces sp. CBMA123 TaxID=1896313 RepID=UPI001DFBF10A|nr:glycogen debranching N-terminal domain-containing protein [Streptomyces sp. CBMA123]MBD0694586.1 amylo-alpha-1,6-glucosidase [Streptomyces sp. CBMA123]